MNPEEFVLLNDDDGHWYVCPADRQRDAEAFFSASATYWSPDSKYEGDPPEDPDWLVPVGGAPSLVRFTGWRVEE